MENNGGQLAFGVTINEDVLERLKELEKGFGSLDRKGKESLQSFENTVEDTFNNIGTSASSLTDKVAGLTAAFIGVQGVQGFVKKVYDVRSYFQDIESSMEVFLGSAEKAAAFTQDLKDYAYYNMFEFSELADASKQLIAYGQEVEKISGKGGILDKLSNIATATKQPLMDLVNLYNRAKNIGTVDSHGLQSWAAKGIVVKDVLKEMGKQANTASITFEELDEVLTHVTSEGGMFYGIMDKMMPNLSASFGQLQDNLDAMWNEIGEKMQGPFTKALDLAGILVDNYEKLGKTIMSLIATYGSYKAAVMVATAIDKMKAMSLIEVSAAERVHYMWLVMQEKAQKVLNKTMLSNPYVLLATAIMGIVTALMLWKKNTTDVTDAIATANTEMARERDELDKLYNVAKDETKSKEEKAKAIAQMNSKYGDYLDNLISENASVQELATSYDTLRKAITNKYLEQVKEQTVGEKAAAYNERQADVNERIAKIIGNSGISSNAQGALTAEVEKYLNDDSKGKRSALTLHEGIKSLFDKYGVQAGFWDNGQLYDELIKLTGSKDRLAEAEKAFNDFAEGYGGAMEKVEDAGDGAADKTGRTVADIVANIKTAEAEIKRLQTKAKSEGLTDSEQKQLTSQTQGLSALKQEYKRFTGIEYGNKKQNNIDAKDDAFYKKLVKDEEKAIRSYYDQIADLEITLKNEGDARVLANMRHQHELKQRAIEEQFQLDTEKIEDREREKYRANNNGSAEGFDFAKVKESDPDVANAVAEAERKKNEAKLAEDKRYDVEQQIFEKNRAQREFDNMNAYFREYGDYQDKKLAVERAYAQKIAEATDKWHKASLEKQREEELGEIALEEEMKEKSFLAWTERLAELSLTQLASLLEQAEAELAASDVNADEDKIRRLQAQIAKLKKEIKDYQAKSTPKQDAIDRWATFQKIFKESADTVQGFGGIFGETVDNLLKDANTITNATMKMIDSIMTLFTTTTKTVQLESEQTVQEIKAVERASVILAIIQAALEIMNFVGKALKEAKEANELAIYNADQYRIALQKLRYEQALLENSTMFGDDLWGRFSTNLDNAVKQLDEVQKQVANFPVSEKIIFGWGQAWYGLSALFSGDVTQGVAAIGAAFKQTGKIMDNIIVDMRSGAQKFFGTGQKNILQTSITEFLDEQGKLNTQKLKEFYDIYKDKMDEATKRNIESLIKAGEEYDNTMKQISDYLSDVFGDLGNSLSDALVEAFKEGTDAANKFGEAMNEIIEKFITNVAYSKFLKPILDRMNKDMDEVMIDPALSDEDKIRKMLIIFGHGLNELKNEEQDYFDWLTEAKKMAEDEGFNILGASRGSASQGIAQASQDSVDELNGRMTAVQGHTYILSENSKIMVATTNEILHQVMGIHDDTARIQQDIADMNTNMRSMKNDINDMASRGVKML